MRTALAAGLTGLALASLAACGQQAAPAANGTAGAASGPAAAAPAGAPGPISADQMPHRQPGLWRQVISMDGQTFGSGTTLCVDATSEAQMTAFAQNQPGAQCQPPQLTRNLDGSINFSSSCDMGQGGKAVTTGVFRGDFANSYTADMDSQITGSATASMNGEHKMTITATRTGACPAGQRGGDMTLGNGMTRNVLDGEPASANATH
jgi:hypothetical protein